MTEQKRANQRCGARSHPWRRMAQNKMWLCLPHLLQPATNSTTKPTTKSTTKRGRISEQFTASCTTLTVRCIKKDTSFIFKIFTLKNYLKNFFPWGIQKVGRNWVIGIFRSIWLDLIINWKLGVVNTYKINKWPLKLSDSLNCH